MRATVAKATKTSGAAAAAAAAAQAAAAAAAAAAEAAELPAAAGAQPPCHSYGTRRARGGVTSTTVYADYDDVAEESDGEREAAAAAAAAAAAVAVAAAAASMPAVMPTVGSVEQLMAGSPLLGGMGISCSPCLHGGLHGGLMGTSPAGLISIPSSWGLTGSSLPQPSLLPLGGGAAVGLAEMAGAMDLVVPLPDEEEEDELPAGQLDDLLMGELGQGMGHEGPPEVTWGEDHLGVDSLPMDVGSLGGLSWMESLPQMGGLLKDAASAAAAAAGPSGLGTMVPVTNAQDASAAAVVGAALGVLPTNDLRTPLEEEMDAMTRLASDATTVVAAAVSGEDEAGSAWAPAVRSGGGSEEESDAMEAFLAMEHSMAEPMDQDPCPHGLPACSPGTLAVFDDIMQTCTGWGHMQQQVAMA
jgi:hypothetical protein